MATGSNAVEQSFQYHYYIPYYDGLCEILMSVIVHVEVDMTGVNATTH